MGRRLISRCQSLPPACRIVGIKVLQKGAVRGRDIAGGGIGRMLSSRGRVVGALPHQADSGHQYRGAFESSRAQISERLVGLLQRIAGGLDGDADLRREMQEIQPVLAGQIRDREQFALLP
jgi:hypothetical protein